MSARRTQIFGNALAVAHVGERQLRANQRRERAAEAGRFIELGERRRSPDAPVRNARAILRSRRPVRPPTARGTSPSDRSRSRAIRARSPSRGSRWLNPARVDQHQAALSQMIEQLGQARRRRRSRTRARRAADRACESVPARRCARESVETSARSRGPCRSTQRAASFAISVVLPTPVGPTIATTPPASIQRSPTVSMRRAISASARRCASASSSRAATAHQFAGEIVREAEHRQLLAAAPSAPARVATDRSTQASRAAFPACGAAVRSSSFTSAPRQVDRASRGASRGCVVFAGSVARDRPANRCGQRSRA